jgi:hypothetical protein
LLLESYAKDRDELRFAITLSMIQYVGKQSSDTDNREPIIKQKVWSFSFEEHDWKRLREEDLAVTMRIKELNLILST